MFTIIFILAKFFDHLEGWSWFWIIVAILLDARISYLRETSNG